MKPITSFLILILSSAAFAGEGSDAGGGTHPCKEDFMDIYSQIQNIVKENPEILERNPALIDVIHRLDVSPSEIVPIDIHITSAPILDCPKTRNPLACGRPNKNKIEIYCREAYGTQFGWLSYDRPIDLRAKETIHELLWWSKIYDDANYNFSKQAARDIAPYLTEENNTLKISTKPIELNIDVITKVGTLRNATLRPNLSCTTITGTRVESAQLEIPHFAAYSNVGFYLRIEDPVELRAPGVKTNLSRSTCTFTLSFYFSIAELSEQEVIQVDLLSVKTEDPYAPDITSLLQSKSGKFVIDYEVIDDASTSANCRFRADRLHLNRPSYIRDVKPSSNRFDCNILDTIKN
jgi:hypothetical protein